MTSSEAVIKERVAYLTGALNMATTSELTQRIARRGTERRAGNVKPFSERVALLRETLKLTQGQFSQKYKIPERTLQNWEQGRLKEPGAAARLLIALIEVEPHETAKLIDRTTIESGLELVAL